MELTVYHGKPIIQSVFRTRVACFERVSQKLTSEGGLVVWTYPSRVQVSCFSACGDSMWGQGSAVTPTLVSLRLLSEVNVLKHREKGYRVGLGCNCAPQTRQREQVLKALGSYLRVLLVSPVCLGNRRLQESTAEVDMETSPCVSANRIAEVCRHKCSPWFLSCMLCERPLSLKSGI